MSDTTRSSNSPSRKTCDLFASRWFREHLLGVLKGAPLSVYVAYVSHADKDGLAWPSLKLLQKETRWGERAVKDAKAFLKTMGLLVARQQERSGGTLGKKKFFVCTDGRKLHHGTDGPFTAGQNTAGQKRTHEGSPSEGSPSRRVSIDAVRRTDAEQRHAASSTFSPSAKRQKLQERMARKIREDRNWFGEIVRSRVKGGEKLLDDQEFEAFHALCFEPDLNDPLLTSGFVEAVVEVVEKHRGQGVPPGILRSKVIDLCRSKQEAAKKLGDSGSEYYWPPSFEQHRNRLREQERRSVDAARAAKATSVRQSVAQGASA